MDTIFWYDYETTGIDPARDRAIQFAGVRTDLNLVVIEEPVEVFCRLSEDQVPHAEALLVSGILVSSLQNKGLRERDFADRIHREFARPNTCVSGYNSLRFDDEFSRYLFYRNFFDPYAREWQSGNSRWDVIDLFRTAYALRPEGLQWPKNDQGNPSFKLELLTQANNVTHGKAHDAVSDVLATIDLTKKLRQAQPRLYDYYYNLRFKRNVLSQLYPLGKAAVVHVSGKYSPSRGCCAIVLPLCTHPVNSNGIICYDLSEDPEPLIKLSPEEVTRRLFTPVSALKEGETRIPLKVIHINRSPSVSPLATLSTEKAERLGLNKEACLENMDQLQKAAGLVEKVQTVFAEPDYAPLDDPEWMLYQGGFFDDADRAAMDALRQMSDVQLAQINTRFRDDRIEELLFRYRARNYPDSLDEDDRNRWREQVAHRWRKDRHPETELENIERLKSEISSEETERLALLEDLSNYLNAVRSRMS